MSMGFSIFDITEQKADLLDAWGTEKFFDDSLTFEEFLIATTLRLENRILELYNTALEAGCPESI